MTWSAAYNGDGARLRQIVNSVPTTYTQDLAAPLPVVLQAKTGSASTQYLVGLGTRPLAEYDSTWEYLLADGLGSVRQLADGNGNVTLSESYDPYGSVMDSQGSATSAFGYTGEQTDSTGLVSLRARYMQPELGMFLSRDPLLTSSPYRYASGNPINRSDPSGYIDWPACVNQGPYRICTSEQGDNLSQIARLINNAGIGLPGNQQAIAQIVSAIYGDNPLLFYGYVNNRGDLNVGTPLKLKSEWVAAVINSGLAPRPTPPTPQPPVAPPHNGLDPNGYVEGRTVSFSAVFVIVTLSGDEMVYDFETMQRGLFHYTVHAGWVGTGFCTTLVGTSISPYVGAVWGFNPPDRNSNIPAIQRDYEGSFVVGQIGLEIGRPIPVSGGGGIVGFSSVFPGSTTPNLDVYGTNAYFDASAGASLPIFNGAVLVADYTVRKETEKQYNSIYEMAQDIRSGNGSPILAPPQARDWAARQALAWWER